MKRCTNCNKLLGPSWRERGVCSQHCADAESDMLRGLLRAAQAQIACGCNADDMCKTCSDVRNAIEKVLR